MFTRLLSVPDENDNMMDINITRIDGIDVIELVGRFDTNSASDVQETITPLAKPGGKILLDMSQVSYMSSAGLRILLMLYRTINDHVGHIVLVGLNEELIDVMAITGFLEFFVIAEDSTQGIALLKKIKS